MRLPNHVCIFTMSKRHSFCTNRADNHAAILLFTAFGTIVCIILEVLGTIDLATSITGHWKEILLLAIWICAMNATIGEMCHGDQGSWRD